jgi:hypothetical protein
MDAVELKIHRMNTKAFIDVRPVQLELLRPTMVRAKTGGQKPGSLQLLPPQTMRIIESQYRVQNTVTLSDGTQREADFMLLGEWDADMKQDDYWVDPETGRNWIVGDVIRPNQYEQRGLVVERGK